MRDGAPQEGLPEENPDSMGTWPDRGNPHPWCADSRERAACPEGTGRYRALPAEQTEAPQGQEEGQGSLQPLRPLRQRAGVPSVTPVRGCTARSHPRAGTKTGATGVPRCEEATASDAGGTARQECAGARSQDRTGQGAMTRRRTGSGLWPRRLQRLGRSARHVCITAAGSGG